MDMLLVDRRHFLTTAAAVAVTGCALGPAGTTAAQAGQNSGQAKIVFVLFKRADLTHEQSMAEWLGAQHTGIVRKVPGLRRWIQNHSTTAADGKPNGIGELWFDNATAMDQGMGSAEMAAAIEDAKRFLDMEKTYALVVSEKAVIA
jgi:uncharacterized protein (TIGR02118 family)